ncbi:hypothetical protein [Methanogenium cariaci]|uniref:hypothetical protein n=1 Tax=Methanogenium cariaci TaxID=2197 RepID=UPI00078579F3|nr:hypothetical protein [Methanogenium cariaci]
MVLAFDGGGGFKAADERDRVAELVAGMLEEVAAPPPAAPAPTAATAADEGALSSAGSTDIPVSAPAPSISVPQTAPKVDVADEGAPPIFRPDRECSIRTVCPIGSPKEFFCTSLRAESGTYHCERA